MPGTPAWVLSPGPRQGWYLKNFYDEQPALDFGWTTTDPSEPWRSAVDAPGPRRNLQALKDVMAFWLDRGVSGFRVYMAFSLVKDEDRLRGRRRSALLWREVRAWLDETYPDAVLVPEGTEPRTDEGLAFHADFFLVIHREHASLFDDHSAGLLPFHPPQEPFFAAEGRGRTDLFLSGWAAAKQADPDRLVLLSTADHDFTRLRSGALTEEQLGAALTFLLTWGAVPCLYYGDEIGMRYLPDAPDVEGAVCNPAYNRAGCRTPMQWDDGPNAGFSTADPSRLYLPIDPAADRPTVAAQQHDPASTLNLVRRLVALRRATPALGTRASTRVLHATYPLTYLRGDGHLVVVNPRREPAAVHVAGLARAAQLLAQGVSVEGGEVRADGFGYGVFALDPASGPRRTDGPGSAAGAEPLER